jgi:hypothetical protein
MALEKIRPRVVDATGNYAFNDVTLTGNVSSPTANIGNLIGVNNLTANSTTITVTGSLSTTANITAGNIKTDNLLYANGAAYSIGSGATIAGSNTQIQFNDASSFGASANLTFDKVSNTLTVAKISGNGSLLTSLTGANVTGTVANSTYAASAGSAASATTADTVTTAAQPNITSVGTLTSLGVTGNITSGNANLGNLATANFFTGNGSLLTSITGANVTGNVGNALNAYAVAGANVSGAVTYAATANAVAGANVMGQVGNALVAGTVYTNAQPNITSVGTLTSLIVGNSTANSTFGNGTITATGNITATNLITSGSGGNISGANYVIANYFSGSGNNLSNIQGANVSGAVSYATTANAVAGANVSGQVGNALVSGTVYTASQPNITSVGTLAGITATGVLNFTGASNVSLGAVGNIKITGGTAGYFITTDGAGNLSWTTVTVSTASISNGNSNVNIPSANGNVNISAVGNANVLVVTGTGVNVSGTLNATGNLTAGNIITSGSGGNISGANNISANTFTGNGSLLTNITGGNVSGQVGNALLAGTVYTNAQPNITSVGTLTSLTVTGDISGANLTLSGNLTVSGTTTTVNSTTTRVVDPIVEQGGGANGAALSSNDNKDRGTLLHYYTGSTATDAFLGWDNSNAEFAFGSNVSVSSDVVTFNSLGNVRASYFLGNGSQLTSVTATTAGTVTTNAQPNITSVGTLTSLGVTGNITSGNATLGNLTTSNYFTGNGSLLTSLTGGNVTGQVGNALLAGTVYTAAQPNITSVGTLSSLGVTGNITAGNINAGNLLTANYSTAVITTAAQPNITSVGTLSSLGVTGNITSGNANLGNLATSNYFSGNGSLLNSLTGGNITGQVGNALVAGTVYTASQPNITSVGTLSSLAVTANITAGNINAGNLLTANYSTAVITTAAQPNITSVGTLTSLAVTGNITSGNANLGNNVTANFFTGSGAYLTSVTAVTAATVTTNAQPNITSVGTLTTLTVGNATANSTFGNGTITTNGNINFTGANVSLGAVGNIKITGGTAGYFITTDGAGNLSWGAASGGGGVSASGSNTQIQFNDGGSLGAVANLVFDKTTNTFSTGRVVASAGANLGSNVSNVYIGGGSSNQILKTDGSGNLTWIAQPVATITVDNFTGDGTTVAFTLSTTPTSKNFTVVNYNGAFQLREAYTVSGTTITFSDAPASGSKVEVTTTSGATSGAGAFTTRTYTGNGVATTFTVTSGCTVSSVIVSENGLIQTPTTDYTISGTTLTFAAAPANGVVIQIRELAIAIVTAPAVTSLTAVTGLNVAVANIMITGGSSGQYLKTDGTGNLSFETVTVPESLSPFLLMGA